MEFGILGSIEVHDGSRSVQLPRGRARALLAMLVLHPGQVLSSELLIDALWGETPPRTVSTALHGLVSSLRKRLEPHRMGRAAPALVVTRPPGYVLAVDPESIDAYRFKRLVAETARVRAPEQRAACLRRALGVWRGPALVDFLYEPFAQAAIAELEELRLAALEECIEAELATGQHGQLLGELESLVARHPFRERLRGQLMLALYRAGRQAEALVAFRDARRVLVEELGIEPGPDLRRLDDAILRQDASLELPARAPAPPPTNLPAPLTSFVGRAREIEELKRLLSGARLITLTGPGGCGKTRLALRVAAEVLPRYEDGVFVVALSALRKPTFIAPAVARALGLRGRPGEPIGESLGRYLAPRQLLLILDGFEHLVDGAAMVTRLLEAAPRVACLVTSREILRLSGEHEYAVPPLEVPDAGEAAVPGSPVGFEAVALFIERAQAADPEFVVTGAGGAAIAEICRRLDGLPLAIELAASRVRALGPEELLGQLENTLSLLRGGPRDVPARQQTLRGSIAWSYGLLPEPEQVVFRRLGVFARGWTLQAARAVVDPGGTLPIGVAEGVEALMGKSLLWREPPGPGAPRFRMLETIREFARATLAEHRELKRLARRHAGLYLRLAEEAELHSRGPDQVAWLDRLEQSHDNVRAALRWSIDSDEAELGMRIAGALGTFWHRRGYFREGRCWLESVLGLPSAASASAARAKALAALGDLALWLADAHAAHDAYVEARSICRQLGDEGGEAVASSNLGLLSITAGEFDEARRLLSAARAVHRRLGDLGSYASDGLRLGLAGAQEPDRAAAIGFFEESLAIFRNLGDGWGLGTTLIALERAYREHGDRDRGNGMQQEALEIFREAGDLPGISLALGAAGALRVAWGDVETGLRLGGAGAQIEEQIGAGPPGCLRAHDARELAAAVTAPRALARAWAAGQSLSIDQAADLMLASSPGSTARVGRPAPGRPATRSRRPQVSG